LQTCYPIALKFGTQQDDVNVHRGIKFGYNTVNGHKVISNYSRKNNTNMFSRPQGKLLHLEYTKEVCDEEETERDSPTSFDS